MNYIQKRAALRKISSIKKVAAAVRLIKLAQANGTTSDEAARMKAMKKYLKVSENSLAGSYAPGYGSLIGAGGGAALGGLTGALISNNENRIRDGLLGALTGGVAGGVGGYSLERYQREKAVAKLMNMMEKMGITVERPANNS